jgi:hypothetical protein
MVVIIENTGSFLQSGGGEAGLTREGKRSWPSVADLTAGGTVDRAVDNGTLVHGGPEPGVIPDLIWTARC